MDRIILSKIVRCIYFFSKGWLNLVEESLIFFSISQYSLKDASEFIDLGTVGSFIEVQDGIILYLFVQNK